MMTCYYMFQELRTSVFSYILWLAINDLGFALSTVVGDRGATNPNSIQCQIQGITNAYFGYCVFLWTFAIAFCTQRVFLAGSPDYHAKMRDGTMFRYHFSMCQIFPIIWALLPLATKSYGETGAWCWIKVVSLPDQVWRGLTLLMTWIVLIYCGYVHTKTAKKLQSLSRYSLGSLGEVEQARVLFIKRFKWYPLALVASNICGTTNRMYQFFDEPLFLLSAFQVATECLQGFFDVIPFASTPVVYRNIIRFFANTHHSSSSLITDDREMNFQHDTLHNDIFKQFEPHDGDKESSPISPNSWGTRQKYDPVEDRPHISEDSIGTG